MKSLFKTVFLIIFFTAITRLAGFLFRIYLSRQIGSESLGVYQISFSIFMVLLTIIASGLPLIVSRLTASNIAKNDKKSEYGIVSSSIIIAVICSIIISLIIFIFQKTISHLFADSRCISILIALLPALIFSSIYCVIRGNLWGHKNYVATCSAELFEELIRIILCIVILSGIFSGISGEMGAAISLSIACVFSCIYVVIWYFVVGGKFKKPIQYKNIIKTSLPITSMRLVTSLVQPIVSIVIPLRLIVFGYTKSQALSLYGIASGMTLPLLYIPLTIIGSLSYALIPDLSSALAKQDTNYVSKRVKSSIMFSLFIGFFMVPLFIGAGQNIGIFFFDNTTCGILLEKSAWIMIPLCLTNITSSILNAVNMEIKSFKNYLVSGVLMIICIWFLPKYIGIQSLIVAMGVCFTISALLNIRVIKKEVCQTLNLKKHIIFYTVFLLPSVAITSFLTNLLNNFIPLLFNLIASCAVGAIFFVLLCIMFNVIEINQIKIWIKENLLSKFKKNSSIKKIKQSNN